MQPLFPGRTRRDLKAKFKKEEKVNGAQLDRALRSATTWDASRLEEEFTLEREADAKKAEQKKEELLKQKLAERERLASARERHVRPSRGSKALGNSGMPVATKKKNTANEVIERALEAKRHSRRRRHGSPEIDMNHNPDPQYATITLIGKEKVSQETTTPSVDMATISRIDPTTNTPTTDPMTLNSVTSVPSNIESGSLVVLTVNDPNSPSKKMLQTYIAHGAGKLTPIALPPTFLNSVVGYMKKGSSKSGSTGSPQVPSPITVTPDGRRSATPIGRSATPIGRSGTPIGRSITPVGRSVTPIGRSATPTVIQMNPSPTKRTRLSSYTITQL